MILVLETLTPILMLVAIGYIAAKRFGLSESAQVGLTRFALEIAIPLTLMRNLSIADLSLGESWRLLVSYYVPMISIFTLGLLIGKLAFNRDLAGSVITGLGFSFGNTVLIGFAVVITLYGDEGSVPYFIIVSIHGLCFITLSTVLLEIAKQEPGLNVLGRFNATARSLLHSPPIIGVVTGLTLNILNLDLPGPVDHLCKLMQDAVAPVALFTLGATLTRYRIAGRIAQNAVLIAVKLLVMPACVFIFAHYLFELPDLWVKGAVLTASMPSGIIASIMAERYDAGRNFATTAIFLSTVLSLFSISFILWFMEYIL